jgi:hypothetical protein
VLAILLATPVASFATSYFAGMPQWATFIVTAFSPAIVAVTLNNYAQWRMANFAQGKIFVHGPIVKSIGDSQEKIVGYSIGITIVNTAVFPVKCFVSKVQSKIDNRVPIGNMMLDAVLIPSGASFNIEDIMISVADMNLLGKQLVANIKADIKYGKQGGHMYSYPEFILSALLSFNDVGLLVAVDISNAELKKSPHWSRSS